MLCARSIRLYRLAAVALCAVVPPAAAEEPAGKLARSPAFRRWQWAFEQRAYPLGDIPAGAVSRAAGAIARRGGIAGAPPSQQWVNVGPAPILDEFIGGGATRPMSGRVPAIAVDPADAQRWLIGAAQGGVWETRDAGATWAPLTEDQPSLATGAIAFAPSAPGVIYVGTGEGTLSIGSFIGAGLLKSVDGGASWQTLASSTFSLTAFTDLAVRPDDADTVLATTVFGRAGRPVTRGGFPPAPPPRGIFRSTDGGVSWSQRLSGDATDLEVDPTDFTRQYAAIGNPGFGPTDGAVANGLYRSADAGVTWTPVDGPWNNMPAGVGRIELALAPSNPNVLYVGIQDRFDEPAVGSDGGLLGLWKTTNAWEATPAWTRISAAAIDDGSGTHGYCGWIPGGSGEGAAEDQCWYNHVLSVAPDDPNALYAGGIGLWRYNGARWVEVSNIVADPANGMHVDQHAMAWAGDRLIVGNDGGVWSSDNAGQTWADHNTNLAITQFYDGSWHPLSSTDALGGSQDNGSLAWRGDAAWYAVDGGDGTGNFYSAANPDTHWAVGLQNGAIDRTTDGGETFSVGEEGIDLTGVPFIARMEKCPAQDDVVITGTDNLWKTTDFFSAARPSWSANGPELGTQPNGRPNGISGLAFAPSDATCRTYVFGAVAGQFLLTADGGASWVDLDAGNAVPDRAVTDFAFDPSDANVLYVTLSGFDDGTPGQPGHVFKTANALAAAPVWTNVSPPVDLPSNAIALDPLVPLTVYAGTDMGVWKSADGGASWTHMGIEAGLPNVAVFDVEIHPISHRIMAFTHGRGAFVAESEPLAVCTGDCNANGAVAINELVRGVNIALGLAPLADCEPFDADGDGQVNISELVAAVGNALNGCR